MFYPQRMPIPVFSALKLYRRIALLLNRTSKLPIFNASFSINQQSNNCVLGGDRNMEFYKKPFPPKNLIMKARLSAKF